MKGKVNMFKEWSKDELDALIDILETEGIATRNDNRNLDSRISRNIESVFKKMGYENYKYAETSLDNGSYTGFIYNTECFDLSDAFQYVKTHVKDEA